MRKIHSPRIGHSIAELSEKAYNNGEQSPNTHMKKSLLQTIYANVHVALLVALALIIAGIVYYKYSTAQADPSLLEMRRLRQLHEAAEEQEPAPAAVPASSSAPSICGLPCGNGGLYECSNGTIWCNDNSSYCQQQCAGVPLNEDGVNGCLRLCVTERRANR